MSPSLDALPGLETIVRELVTLMKTAEADPLAAPPRGPGEDTEAVVYLQAALGVVLRVQRDLLALPAAVHPDDVALDSALTAKAAHEGGMAVSYWRDYRAQTGGWWDCEGCGDCYDSRDFHVLEAFEQRAFDAIHFACLALAERDALAAQARPAPPVAEWRALLCVRCCLNPGTICQGCSRFSEREPDASDPRPTAATQNWRCDGVYPVPHRRDEPFGVTYRCALPKGHEGPHGAEGTPPLGAPAAPVETPQEDT